MIVDLTQLKAGQKGTVVAIDGGIGVVSKLSGMGLRPGKKITKISAQFIRGPQVVAVGHTKIAVGFGMGRKILVEVQK